MLTIRGVLQAVLSAVGFIAGHDIATQTGFDWRNPAFYGDLFVVLSTFGLTFGLTKDRFVQFVTFGLAVVRKFDESDLPNGCNATMNWIVAGIKRGVDPDELKPTYDAQWEVIVEECSPRAESR